jgi:hypothetical protein
MSMNSMSNLDHEPLTTYSAYPVLDIELLLERLSLEDG